MALCVIFGALLFSDFVSFAASLPFLPKFPIIGDDEN